MSLIDQLIAKGWGRCHCPGLYVDAPQVTCGALVVAERKGVSHPWQLIACDFAKPPVLLVAAKTPTDLLHARIGRATGADLLDLDLPPLPTTDDVITERLIASGWEWETWMDGQGRSLARGHWQIHPAGLYFCESQVAAVGAGLLELMRRPVGATTVAAICGITVDDLEEP